MSADDDGRAATATVGPLPILEAIVGSIQDGISVWDQNRRLVAWNQAYQSIFELADGALSTGLPINEVLVTLAQKGSLGEGDPQELADRAEARLYRSATVGPKLQRLEGGKIVDVRRFPMPNGGHVAITRDVTEERNRERSLRQSEARFRELLDNSPIGIAIVSRVSNRRLFANRRLVEMFGATTADDLVNQDIANSWCDQEAFARSRAIVGAGHDLVDFEAERRRLDGSRWWVLMNSHQIDFEGEPARVVWHNDITDRIVAEAKLVDHHEHLEQRVRDQTAQLTAEIEERIRHEHERERLIQVLEDKNQELERFTYTVSHDLKGPLVTIGGFLGVMERRLGADQAAAVAEEIGRIRSAAEDMRDLLDDLLEISRIGRVVHDFETVPLREIVDIALSRVDGQLKAHGVAVDVAESLPDVTIDRSRMISVFQNLFDNSAKFMGSQPAPRITVSAQRTPEGVEVRVGDNGIGIDLKFQERIFGLFERLDKSTDGTGIGLAMAERIVALHGGTITVESDGPGTGATFVIALPTEPHETGMRRRWTDSP